MIFKLTPILTPTILLAVTLVYGVNLRRGNEWMKLFFIYLVCLLVTESSGIILWLRKENNLGILHIFSYLEWFLLSVFYAKITIDNFHQKINLAGSVLALLPMLYGSLFLYEFDEFQVVGYFSLKLFITVFSLRELYFLNFENKVVSSYIHLGLILSSVVGMVIFSFGNILTEFKSSHQVWIWTFNALVHYGTLGLFVLQITNSDIWKSTK